MSQEDFARVFTVEIQGAKGWQVISTHNDIGDALHRFTSEMEQTPIVACRLTSPTDLSIYDTAPPLTDEEVEADHQLWRNHVIGTELHSVRADLH